MSSLIKKFAANTSGATAIEYGLIAGLIAVAVIGSISALGSANEGSFTDTYQKISDAI